MNRHPAALLLVIGIALAPHADAWGPDGHRIVAEIAQRNLQPAARAEALRLLAIDGETSLADVSNWADAIRDQPSQAELAKPTRPMHYMRFTDSGCTYDPARTCAEGGCIVSGIERFTAILSDRTRTDAERAQALRFVVHFVGDVHQPLHAGYRSNRGGFAHAIRYEGRDTSMHAIWDYDIISSRGLDWREYATQLDQRESASATAFGKPAEWAEQSCRITRDRNLYPDGNTLAEDYMTTMRPIVETRLREAATRLTVILDAALR